MEELSAQEVCGWLEGHKGKSMIIQKEEQQDMDQIEFELEDVGLMRFTDTLDNYLSPQTIVLHGSGSIETHDGQKQNLPENSYEIPIIGDFHGFQNENGIKIQTERAEYTIFIQ